MLQLPIRTLECQEERSPDPKTYSSLSRSRGLTGGGSSPAWSFNVAAASISPAAILGSDVAFAIFSSATAASRA